MTILKNNIKRIFKKKSNWFFMIVLPVIFMSILVSSSMVSNTYYLGVSDNDNTEFTKEFIKNLSVKYEIVTVALEDMESKVIDSEIDYGIVIHEGTTEKIIQGELLAVDGYSIKETDISIPLKIFINSYMSAASGIGEFSNGNEEAFYTGMDHYLEGEFSSSLTQFESNVASNELIKRSFGFLVLAMAIILTFSATTNLKDKKSGIYLRVLTGPVRKSGYVMQDFLSYVMIGLLQIVLVLMIMMNMLGLDIQSIFVETLIIFSLFAIVCVSIGTFVSSLSNDTKKANAYLNIINVPMCMLGGCMWPVSIMPEFLQQVANILPTTWALKAANRIVDGASLAEIGTEIGVLVIFSIVFLGLSIRDFKWMARKSVPVKVLN